MLTGCTGSVWHRKALAPLFSVYPGCFIEWLVIAQRRIANARQLVRQRAGGLVVVASPLHFQRPAAHTLIERATGWRPFEYRNYVTIGGANGIS